MVNNRNNCSTESPQEHGAAVWRHFARPK